MKNPYDFKFDFMPTNEDMVNNKENIINCIKSTDDINLIMIHRSLYILKKKFEQNKEVLKKIYQKYGEILEKEENILIEEKNIPLILKEIFDLNKFEISYFDDFKEALFKEMNYCKEINIEEYIFNEFIEFIRNNRKRYNFIFREKRNNTVFNLENYERFELNLVDDLTKEAKIDIVDEDEEEDNIDFLNNKKKKLPSAKFNNKLVLEDIKPKNKDNLKINLDLVEKNNTIEGKGENKDDSYSYSESEVVLTNRSGKAGRNIKNESESGEGTQRSLNSKIKYNETKRDKIIEENSEEESKENNEIKDNNEIIENKEEENNENLINKDENQEQFLNNNNEEDKSRNIKSTQLLFSSKRKKIEIKEKVFYETIYKKNYNIKSIRFLKHYLYADILPLIIADFISDERNLYIILDHSDDFRKNLSSIFDIEILNKLGDNNFEEVLNQKTNKISELKNTKSKVEKNIENYEKISKQMKEGNRNIEYIEITLKKLKEFLNWLNTKIHVIQNDILLFSEYERNKKEKEDLSIYNYNNINEKINNKKSKKQKIIDDYKQIKRDLEIRKFMLMKQKMIKNSKKNKLKPIINKNINNNAVNNSNNSNNISNIENENSNNNIDSAEMSDDYNNSFLLSDNNISNKKKPKFNYPKIKKLNFKIGYDDLMKEKSINYEEDEEEEEKEDPSNNNNLNEEESNDNNMNLKINEKNILKKSNIREPNKINKYNKTVKFSDEVKENNEDENGNKENEINEEENNNINENNLYNNLKINEDEDYIEKSNKNDKKINKKNKIINAKIDTNKSQKLNIKIKENKNTKNILKSIHDSKNNINMKEKLVTYNSLNNYNKPKKELNNKNEKKINKKVRYILKKIEEPKVLTKEEKREIAIKEIFDFYTNKNTIMENKSKTFDKIQNKKGHLSLNEYCRFCNDFKIPLTKDKIFSLFNKSTSNNSKIMEFQEFKISLISMSFAINDFQIEEINRSINIFIGKERQKNKERSRFEKYDEKEVTKNKEIIKEKMEEIEKIQNRTEDEIIEEFFEFLEIDDKDKYWAKMKRINKVNEITLPKININENNLMNNKGNEYSKTNSILEFAKRGRVNSKPKIKKIKVGKQFWIKDMIDKEKRDTPERVNYVLEESDEEEEKDENFPNLPVIESPGIPLFSKNKKIENKYYDD